MSNDGKIEAYIPYADNSQIIWNFEPTGAISTYGGMMRILR